MTAAARATDGESKFVDFERPPPPAQVNWCILGQTQHLCCYQALPEIQARPQLGVKLILIRAILQKY